jgi:hypothetical protein
MPTPTSVEVKQSSWWEKHKVWLYTEDQRDWEIRRKYGMTVDKEILMDDCWIRRHLQNDADTSWSESQSCVS